MKNNKIISIVLTLIMSVQILPFAQVGFALGNAQWTEERPHTNAEEGGKVESGNGHFLPVQPHQFANDLAIVSACNYIHASAQIPSNHSNDIVSPPPDKC